MAGDARPSLWFITPAWRRPNISRLCFTQHAAVHAQLALQGIDSTSVIVSDDENLDIAREHGFATVEAPNTLGSRFNDGIQFAASQGVDYICPLGSDSWIHPDRFVRLPAFAEFMCARNYTVIRPDGGAQARLHVGYSGGLGSRIMRTALLHHCGYRPLREWRVKGCDSSLLRAVRQRFQVTFTYCDLHPFEAVGFQSDVQVTPYDRLLGAWLVEERPDAFDGLQEHYPGWLVERARAVYAEALSPIGAVA